MFPIRDNIPSRTIPVVNYTMIGLCLIVFALQLTAPDLIERFGLVPARMLHPHRPLVTEHQQVIETPYGPQLAIVQERLPPAAIPDWLTPLTCVFLHGGWMHVLGNMWFLHIFGDNVEDRFGHLGYVFFYLGAGVCASLAHLASDPSSAAPTIGASGAIAGVMGAYLVLYPRALVLAALPLFVIVQMVVVPAPLFLGIWFVMQFFQGVASIQGAPEGGVAWWAHIGGFAFGAIGALLSRPLLRPPVDELRPGAEQIRRYRLG